MSGKIGYIYFLTGGLLLVLGIVVWRGGQLTQPQQDLLAAGFGALTMALQSVVHSLYVGNGSPPSNPTQAAAPPEVHQ